MAYPTNGKHHAVSVYAKQVVSGRLHDQCCPAEIAACARHLRDLDRQGTPGFPYVFDTTRADRIYNFFRLCRHVRGIFQGQLIELQPWQKFGLGCLYGWVHQDTGARRFSHALNKRCRGTVKSTENAVKCLYHMTADCIYPPYRPDEAVFEMSPECECAAVDSTQADRVYGDARAIALASPMIAKQLIIPKSNAIKNRRRGGKMRKLSKSTDNKDSGAPTYYCLDEYESHNTSVFYDLGFNSLGKRAQPLLDCIMTAGDNAESRPAKREEDYARRVVFGEIEDETYFVMLRELPPDQDPHDKSKWCWACPMLRYPDAYVDKLRGQIEDEYKAAYGSGDPDKIRAFLTRRMCQWQAASVNSYLSEPQLELARAAQVGPDAFAALVKGLPAWAGFDLGKRVDLTGTAIAVPLPDDRYAIAIHGFMPEDGADRHEHTDRVPYRAWAKHDYCTLTPGAVTDNSYAYNWICERERRHELELQEIDYDGHNATDLAVQICNDRNNEDFCVEIRQTCSGQTLAVKSFRELLLQGRLVFERSPLLMWCLGNAVVVENNYGDIKLSKRHKDDSQRIDPVAAAMNAMARALLRDESTNLARAAAGADYEM